MQKLVRWVRSCREARAGNYRQIPEQVSHTQRKTSLLIRNLHLLGLQFIPQGSAAPTGNTEAAQEPPRDTITGGTRHSQSTWQRSLSSSGQGHLTNTSYPVTAGTVIVAPLWERFIGITGLEHGRVPLPGHSHPYSLQSLHSCTDARSVTHTCQRTLKHTYGCGENNDLHLFCFIYIHILNFNTKEKKLESDKCLQTRYLQIDFTQFSLVQSK